MKKNSTVATRRKQIFKHKQLTIGMDLGDRFTYYCVLDEAGEVMVEQKLPTTRQAMKQVFGGMPSSRVALETGAHSPWVSRQLTPLGREVIVAHARPSSGPTFKRKLESQGRFSGWRQRRMKSIEDHSTNKLQNRLDTNRPSHGRSWRAFPTRKDYDQ